MLAQPTKKPPNPSRLTGFLVSLSAAEAARATAVYILPVLLDVVEVLVFLLPLWLFILLLRSVLPFMELLSALVLSTVPSFRMPVPRCGCVLTLLRMASGVLLPEGEGVVWAKAAVFRKKAQAAATRILVVCMILWSWKQAGEKKATASHLAAATCLIRQAADKWVATHNNCLPPEPMPTSRQSAKRHTFLISELTAASYTYPLFLNQLPAQLAAHFVLLTLNA